MKGSLQIVFGKSNSEELQFAIRWETKKETNLKYNI